LKTTVGARIVPALEDYQSFVTAANAASDTKTRGCPVRPGNAWLEAGDQEKAGQALGNAVRNGQLDAASGETPACNSANSRPSRRARASTRAGPDW